MNTTNNEVTQVSAVSLGECKPLVYDVLKAGLVPMVVASPGVGKSALAKEIAEERNLLLIDLRLSQADPTDLNGFPFINQDKTKAGYVPMDSFPIEGDSLPIKTATYYDENDKVIEATHYAGWFLLLDEFNSAPISVQAAAYKLVLDKQVGPHNLHPKVAIMCAGNLMSDKAIVNRTGTAMQSRLVHLEVEINAEDWLVWGQANNIDYRILGFIGFREELLHNFDPNHNDKTFPCPRTWHFLSNIIKPWNTVTSDKLPVIAGTIGVGAAQEFKAFCDVFGEIPDIADIVANPDTVKFKDDPSVFYALSALIANHMDATKEKTLEKLAIFVNRLPIEFHVITFQSAIRRDPALIDSPCIDKWIEDNHQDLM